jgi:predicted NAD-dependent protein-ADP-ribosyltransferase YbiA (DUF1768 family)
MAEIKFGSSEDSQTGYLSNESVCSFNIDGDVWPTVVHYVEAKKFEGTTYEETIRKAKTVFQARQLAKEKCQWNRDEKGQLICQKGYGKLGQFRIREDWDVEKPIIYENAIRAKFMQNKRLLDRLVDTGDVILTDLTSPYTGKILMRIRNEELKKRHKNKEEEQSKNVKAMLEMKDIPHDQDTLSKTDNIIIRGLILLSKKVAKEDGCEKILPENVEDAIYNLVTDKKLGYDLMDMVRTFYTVNQWNDIYHNMPRFERNIRAIYREFEKHDVKSSTQAAAYIALIIRWVNNVASPLEKSDIVSRIKTDVHTRHMEIIFPPVQRWYRSSTIPKVHKNTQEEEEVTTVNVGEDESIKMDSPTLPVYIKSNDKYIEVAGKELKRHAAQLLAMGGKFTDDKSAIIFALCDYDIVVSYVFDQLTDSEKYDLAYRDWLKSRIGSFLDTASYMAHLRGDKTIEEHDIVFTIEILYSTGKIPAYIPDTKIDYTEMLSEILASDRFLNSFILSPDAKDTLTKWVNHLGIELLRGIAKGTYHDYLNRLDQINHWVLKSTKSFCSESEDFNSNQVCFLRAMTHIITAVHYSKELPLNPELFSLAFTLIIPKGERRKAAQVYMGSVMKRLDENMGMHDIHAVLEKHGIAFDLSLVENMVNAFITEFGPLTISTCENQFLCLAIMAIGMSFITESLLSKKSDKLQLRLRVLANLKPSSSMPDGYIADKEDVVLEIPLKEQRPFILKQITERVDNVPLGLLVDSTSDTLPCGDKLIDKIYGELPYANIYHTNMGNGYVLGTLEERKSLHPVTNVVLSSTVAKPHVINIIAQMNPGGPRKILDTQSNREKWFEKAIKQLDVPEIMFYKSQLPDKFVHLLEITYKGTVYMIEEVRDERDLTGAIAISPPMKEVIPAEKEVIPTVSDNPTELTVLSNTTAEIEKKAQEMGLDMKVDESQVEQSIQRGIRYNKIIGPLHFDSELYSKVIDKLEKLQEAQRQPLLNQWDALKVNERKFAIQSWIL